MSSSALAGSRCRVAQVWEAVERRLEDAAGAFRELDRQEIARLLRIEPFRIAGRRLLEPGGELGLEMRRKREGRFPAQADRPDRLRRKAGDERGVRAQVVQKLRPLNHLAPLGGRSGGGAQREDIGGRQRRCIDPSGAAEVADLREPT